MSKIIRSAISLLKPFVDIRELPKMVERMDVSNGMCKALAQLLMDIDGLPRANKISANILLGGFLGTRSGRWGFEDIHPEVWALMTPKECYYVRQHKMHSLYMAVKAGIKDELLRTDLSYYLKADEIAELVNNINAYVAAYGVDKGVCAVISRVTSKYTTPDVSDLLHCYLETRVYGAGFKDISMGDWCKLSLLEQNNCRIVKLKQLTDALDVNQ